MTSLTAVLALLATAIQNIELTLTIRVNRS